MSYSVRETLVGFAYDSPYSATLLSTFLVFVSSLLIVAEIFKPTGKRNPPAGKKWRLPPGPQGTPIFGSLFDLKAARGDVEHTWVSLTGAHTQPPVEMEKEPPADVEDSSNPSLNMVR